MLVTACPLNNTCRQDAASEGYRWRGGRTVLLLVRIGIRGDVRGGRRQGKKEQSDNKGERGDEREDTLEEGERALSICWRALKSAVFIYPYRERRSVLVTLGTSQMQTRVIMCGGRADSLSSEAGNLFVYGIRDRYHDE